MRGMRAASNLTSLGLAALLAACASPGPDVVAMNRPAPDAAAPYLDPTPASRCRAGFYKGSFATSTSPDASSTMTLQGDIAFTLEVSQSGEFLRLASNAPLSGTSDQGASFNAVVEGNEACKEGAFRARLVNGTYVQGTFALPFDGEVTGEYLPEQNAFIGEWRTYYPGPPRALVAQGHWLAQWRRSMP